MFLDCRIPAQTGPIISAAGLIMAVSFGGLLASSTTSLNQMGFILCVAVLLDTLVFHAFFVPATMMLIGDANWFPGNKCMVAKE